MGIGPQCRKMLMMGNGGGISSYKGAGRGGAGRGGPNDNSCGAGAGSAFSARAVSLKICTLFVPISWCIT